MAVGDWGKGVSLRPGVVNVAFLAGTSRIIHVGIGYEVLSATGEVLRESGFTWQPPSTPFPSLPPTATFQDVVAALGLQLVGDLLASEGLPLWQPPPTPPPPVPPLLG